jgi:hypothetical protein
VQEFVVIRPILARIVRAIAHPHDETPAPAEIGGKAVDIRYDITRRRYFALMTGFAEIILHVDYNQRCFARIDFIEWMQLAGAPRHALGGGFGKRDLVHFFILD